MGTLGNQPNFGAYGFTRTQAESFNGNGSATAFTLGHHVKNAIDIEVLVDNVQQSPFDGSYSVSGTTLTFSGAPASGTNNVYVMYRQVGTVIDTQALVPDDNSVTYAKLSNDIPLGNRNLLINGEFDIDQRGLASSRAFQSGAHYVADRWSYYINSGAFATFSANHEISDEAPSGFTKSLKVTCTSGGSIPATGEVIYRQKIEGYNFKRLGYGTPSAKSLTLSFWIKASVTGDYGVQLIYEADDSSNKYYVSKYTVNSANTWEYKTITIPPNTADAFKYTTTGLGAQIYWDLGEGSTYSGTADSGWTNTYSNGLSGGVKLMENTGATWQKTGVQLEVGTKATPFEHRSYGDELAKCQRYFEKIGGNANYERLAVGFIRASGTSTRTPLFFKVEKRAPPSITASGSIQIEDVAGYHIASGVAFGDQSINSVAMAVAVTGRTAGSGCLVTPAGTTTFYIHVDAEL
jgi:hypothetical protein